MIDTRNVATSQLYFGQYQYCLSFAMPHSSQMRDLDPVKIVRNLRWKHVRWRSNHFAEADEVLDAQKAADEIACLKLAAELRSATEPFRRVCYWSSQAIYSNNLAWLEQLGQLPGIQRQLISTAVVSRPHNQVQLRESAWGWRSYFKEQQINKADTARLREFFHSRGDYFRLTDSFIHRLELAAFTMQRWQFVDHHSESDVTMLTMFMPGLVRKTMPIVTK